MMWEVAADIIVAVVILWLLREARYALAVWAHHRRVMRLINEADREADRKLREDIFKRITPSAPDLVKQPRLWPWLTPASAAVLAIIVIILINVVTGS